MIKSCCPLDLSYRSNPVACQSPLPMEFSKQEYWSGLAISPLQGIFLIQGMNPGLLNYWQIIYSLSHQGRPFKYMHVSVRAKLLQLCLTLRPHGL